MVTCGSREDAFDLTLTSGPARPYDENDLARDENRRKNPSTVLNRGGSFCCPFYPNGTREGAKESHQHKLLLDRLSQPDLEPGEGEPVGTISAARPLLSPAVVEVPEATKQEAMKLVPAGGKKRVKAGEKAAFPPQEQKQERGVHAEVEKWEETVRETVKEAFANIFFQLRDLSSLAPPLLFENSQKLPADFLLKAGGMQQERSVHEYFLPARTLFIEEGWHAAGAERIEITFENFVKITPCRLFVDEGWHAAGVERSRAGAEEREVWCVDGEVEGLQHQLEGRSERLRGDGE
ncbi:unnamed protein product [Closterium sp. Naga37s-1]|nr:unnamed protein product [Closterium sp. Naga37s-1]